jgi:NADH-quinone oxidoreductase subunit M
MGLLSVVVLLPAVCGILLAAVARWLSPRGVKSWGIAASIAGFAVSLKLAAGFTPGAGFQFVERVPWVPSFGISYALGIDGISLALVLLTTFLTPLALLCAWGGSTASEKSLTILMLVLETAMLGVFCATDLFLFYVFWETSLIPMYFIIGIWGGPRRIHATLKFFLFTFAGSVLMLVAIVALALQHSASSGALSFDAGALAAMHLPLQAQRWLFWAFFLAFAIKVPVIPVHTWLPDAHVEAPTAGSVILAGVLLKMGGYGILRFCFGLFPEAAVEYRFLLTVLGIAGILYGAGMVMVQTDLKRLVAYSSVSHMGYVIAGLGSLTAAGLSGGVVQMVSHGLATGALFAIVGMLYDRTHSRDLAAYGGVSRVLPHFSWAFLLVTLASIGLPGTSGFVAEFAVLLGLARYKPVLAGFAVIGVILSAVYMLTMFRRVMLGPVQRAEIRDLKPLALREGVVLACLLLGIMAIGVFPSPLLKMIQPDVAGLLAKLGGG